MANLIIKSSADDLVLKGSGGNSAITVGSTGNTTLSGTANNLGTSTAGTLSSGIAFPAGHIIQVKGTDNFHGQNFDGDHDVIIETSLTNVLASSYVVIFGSTTVNIASNSGEGLETTIYRKATTMGVAGTAISGATKINATGGNEGSASFTYMETLSNAFNMYAQASYWCIDESPATGTNFYALVGSGYASQTPGLAHDGNSTILTMEIAQ